MPSRKMARLAADYMTVKVEKSPGFCLGCDYPLNGLTTNRCPECGRPFDPADPHTINLEVPIGQFGRFCMKPFGWGMPIVAFLYLLLCFWETRVPLGPMQFPFASKYVGAFLWILWMTRVMLLAWAIVCGFADTNLVRPGGWRLAWLVPFLVVLAITLVGWDVPTRLGFNFSRPALEKLGANSAGCAGCQVQAAMGRSV